MTLGEITIIEQALNRSPEVEWDWFVYKKNDQGDLSVSVVGYTKDRAVVEVIDFTGGNYVYGSHHFNIKHREGDPWSVIGKGIADDLASSSGGKVRSVENTFSNIRVYQR